MKKLLTASQVEALSRQAKKLARDQGVLHSHALDQLARENGYTNWSLLKKSGELAGPQPYEFRRSGEEMAAALRVVRRSGRFGPTASEIVRSRTADLSGKFISAANAVDYAIAYMETLLARPRFRVAPDAVANWEMRSWLPYGAVSTTGDAHLLVNRNYKPLGSPSTDFAQYEAFPHLHLMLDGTVRPTFAAPGSSQPFLYNDGCLPWRSRENARAYLARLRALRQHLS